MSVLGRILRLIRCLLLAAIAAVVIPILIQLIKGAIWAASQPVPCDDLLARLARAFGVPCAAYQAAVRAYGWLMVLAFVVILLGLLLAIARCVINSFRSEKEEKRPTVIIHGAGPLLLYAETATTGSPLLVLEGVGDPPGGTYAWSVRSGADKIRIEGGTNQSSLSLKPVARSDSPGDVVLQLSYSTSEGTATAQESLTVHTPSSARQISKNTTTFSGPVEFGYDCTVRYRILNQFGAHFPAGFLSVSEDLTVIVNPYHTQFEEREFTTDANAEYDDHYTLIFDNQPVPHDYLAKVRQIVKAAGIKVLDHIIVWKSTHVDFE